MNIKYISANAHPGGFTKLTIVVDTPPTELLQLIEDASSKPYVLDIKPYRKKKTLDQVAAIWGKIGDIVSALGATSDEIYLECLKRYGPSTAMRVPIDAVNDLKSVYRLVEPIKERDDGTVFVMAYKGLHDMNTQEASRLLDGILSECKEIGINAEVEK